MNPEQYFNYLNFALTWATNTGYLREDVIRSPAEAGHIPAQRMHTWNHTEFSMRLEYLGNGAFGIVWKVQIPSCAFYLLDRLFFMFSKYVPKIETS